jgi:hypothetical protein
VRRVHGEVAIPTVNGQSALGFDGADAAYRFRYADCGCWIVPAIVTSSSPITPAGSSSCARPTTHGWSSPESPTGGGGSNAEAAYINFMQKDCRDTLSLARDRDSETSEPLDEPLRSVYEGAAAACLAAFEGESELWQTARERHAGVDASGLGYAG